MLSEIVNVVITKDLKNVSRQGFGTVLLVGPNVNINSRLEYFADAAPANAVITGVTPIEKELINAIFSQNPSVVRIALGALSSSKTFTFSGTLTAGSIVAVVNGTTYTQAFTTDKDTTLTALAAKIATNGDVQSCSYTALTGVLLVTPKTAKAVGVVLTLSVTGTLSYVVTATELSETYPDALNLINAEQSDWYGIVCATRDPAKQLLISTWAEANKKFYAAASADMNIVNQAKGTDTTSIAALTQNANYERTAVVFTKNAATEGPEAGLLGKILPLDPGTYTAKFKILSGVTVDNLTPTQSTNARAKSTNTFENIGGQSIITEGTVAAGEFIDIVIFIDWLTARMTEAVFASLVSPDKVPYTTQGIMIVKTAMETPLKLGQDRGGISSQSFDNNRVQDGGYSISMPQFASIPKADKIIRQLANVKFKAFLAGAIHSVVINGVVTV